jgi:hypothetical protein
MVVLVLGVLGAQCLLGAVATGFVDIADAAGSTLPPTIHPRVYAGGGVIGFGDAGTLLPAATGPLSSVMVAMATDPVEGRRGYWLASADGSVYTAGGAAFWLS